MPRNADFIRRRRIKLIWYNNVSLIKTRCRASRRGEGFSPVAVRLPNPYENVHLCLEFAIYQTHVKTTILWTISICFMLFSQVLSIFLRVLCEVVTHRKTIIT